MQHRSVVDPEIPQRLGVHAYAATQPLESDVFLTEAGKFAGAADPLHGGVQPKRQQNSRVRRRVTDPSGDRLDGCQQRSHVEPQDKLPYQTRPVICLQQLVQAERAPSHLVALRATQTWHPAAHPLRRRLLGQSLEQRRRFILRHRLSFASNPTPRVLAIAAARDNCILAVFYAYQYYRNDGGTSMRLLMRNECGLCALRSVSAWLPPSTTPSRPGRNRADTPKTASVAAAPKDFQPLSSARLSAEYMPASPTNRQRPSRHA